MRNLQSIKQDTINKFYRCFIKYTGKKSHRKELANCKTTNNAVYQEVYNLFCADIVESTARVQKVYEDFDKWYDHFHKKDSDWVVWATTILIMLLTSAAVVFK